MAWPRDFALPPMSPLQYVPTLYSQHADSARALAGRLLFDRCEAEDVVHDVFLTLWRRPDCFDPARGTDRSWLLTVVRNRSLDHLRRRCGKHSEDVADLAERLPDPPAPDTADGPDPAARNAALCPLWHRLPPL